MGGIPRNPEEETIVVLLLCQGVKPGFRNKITKRKCRSSTALLPHLNHLQIATKLKKVFEYTGLEIRYPAVKILRTFTPPFTTNGCKPRCR